MHEFQIAPHIGIGPILLGASRRDVREALSSIGFPLIHSRDAMDYFCESAIQVEFGDDHLADFMGFAGHTAFTLTYRGTNVFDVPAEQVFARIAHHEGSEPHVFNDREYVFPTQIITLWDAALQYDKLGGNRRAVWGQVGLGNQRYLDEIRRIESPDTR